MLTFSGKRNGISYNPATLNPTELGPPNYRLYDYMEKYSKEYEIPLSYCLRQARIETGYMGRGDFSYRPFSGKRIREEKAVHGPLQVKLTTARYALESNAITAKDLRSNLELSTKAGLAYVKKLRKEYKDWRRVYSVYNQGVIGVRNINQYSQSIVIR